MAEIIVVENFPANNIVETSKLTADAAAAQALIAVENADGYSTDDYVVVGELGKESSELIKIGSVSGKNITLSSNLNNKHYDNESVTKVRANQARIYRAANVDGTVPDDADFSLLTTQNLQADQLYIEYLDTAGSSAYWYKYTFYNSTSTDEGALSDSIATRGGNYGLYTNVEEVRDEAGLKNNPWITDQFIYLKLIKAQSEVDGSLMISGYSLPLTVVPEVVSNATLLIAAGYVLMKDYGPEHSGTNKDGQSKLAMGRALLKQIEKKEILLIDPTTSEKLASTNRVRGYPDDTAADNTPAESRMFTITDRF